MIRSIVLPCVLLLTMTGRATAQPADELAGTWAFKVEGRNLVVLTLAVGPEGLRGTMHWPARIIWSPAPSGIVVSDVQGDVFSASIKEVRAESSGRVITYATPDGDSNESIVRLGEENRLSFDLVAESPGIAKVAFVRVENSAIVARDWDKDARYYVRDPAPPPNAEIAAIFAADQADRQQLATIDWAVVGPRDEARRTRVRQMLDEGLLRAADDYYYAAMIYQHGEAPEDYVLAHALAMTAQAAGRPDAAWIAAATFDRLLRNLDRPQVFGTQYVGQCGQTLTMGQYDAALIPDSLRSALGVPTLEQQDQQRLLYEKLCQAR